MIFYFLGVIISIIHLKTISLEVYYPTPSPSIPVSEAYWGMHLFIITPSLSLSCPGNYAYENQYI